MTHSRSFARRSALLSLMPTMMLGAGVRAQAPERAGVSRRPSSVPAAAPVGALDGRSLKAGSWKYSTTISGGGQSQTVPRTLTIAASTLDQRAAWLLVDTQGEGQMTVVDSLYLTRETLAPMQQALHIGPARMLMRFSADSVVGEAVSPQGSQTLRAAYTRGAMVNGPMLEAALRVLPLRAGWRASVQMLGLRPDGAQVAPVLVSVSGEETVTVPAGTFPSWVVQLGGEAGRQKLWLSKSTGQIVKVSMQAQQGVSAETVMVSSGAR